jgi:hypothetical protein
LIQDLVASQQPDAASLVANSTDRMEVAALCGDVSYLRLPNPMAFLAKPKEGKASL